MTSSSGKVSVPVLSNTTRSTSASRSMASPELSSTPVRNMAPETTVCTAGNRQPERAGAGDDENRDRGDDGIVPGRAVGHPAQHGQQRRRVHDGGIEPRRAVGELHIAGARLHGVVEQPADLRQQRAFGRRRHPHPQGARQIERAGIDGSARPGLDRQGLAGDQALVDLGLPSITEPSTAERSPGRSRTMSPARTAAIGTTLISSAPTNFGRGFRLQRGEISGHRARLAAHALIEIAAASRKASSISAASK